MVFSRTVRLLAASAFVGAIAVGAIAVVPDAFACKFIGGASHYCSLTRTVGTWSGSFITGTTLLGDTQAQLEAAGPGFFNAEWETPGFGTPESQHFPCKHDGRDAICAATVKCVNFAIGTCSKGRRISRMECPTANASPGCTGQITVTLINGEFAPGVVSKTFEIKTNDVPKNQCNQQFPRINGGLNHGVIGEIVQSCTTQGDVTLEPVLSSSVRSDLNDDNPSETYAESTITVNGFGGWAPTVNCDPQPADGYPSGACSHDGGAWLKVLENPLNPSPILNPALCAAAAKDLSCGEQIVDEQVVPGPAPISCELQGGDCRCRCARCNSNGTLVNLGAGGTGTFVLSDLKGVMGTRPWAAACAVTVTGN